MGIETVKVPASSTMEEEYIPTVTRMDDANFKPLLRNCLRHLSPINPHACDHISEWDTSRVTDCSYLFFEPTHDLEEDWILFESAEIFNVDISRWDTSSCTSMKGMFSGAVNFNQDLSMFNTQWVTDMSQMFENAHAFDQDLRTFNTHRVTDMSRMFQYASEFAGRGLETWDVSRVESFHAMFSYASSFEGQGVDRWNVSAASDFSSMFEGATVFNEDIGDWTLRKDVDVRNMFHNAKSFRQALCWDLNTTQKLDLLDRSNEITLDSYCRIRHVAGIGTGWKVVVAMIAVCGLVFAVHKRRWLHQSGPIPKTTSRTDADDEEEEISFGDSNSTCSHTGSFEDEAGEISFVEDVEPSGQLFPLLDHNGLGYSAEMESLTEAASDLAAMVANLRRPDCESGLV